jgi:pimeloyl-ACP methyl ester carboxylesterase
VRNMDNRINEKWGLLRRTDVQNEKLALFVHGFGGGYLDTWGRLPDLLKTFADSSPPFDSWDYLFVGYDTGNVETYLDIARLMATPIHEASAGNSPYDHPYDTFSLFGHSLGTLGIRQLLCAWNLQPKNFLNAVSSVVLFGSPVNGSRWARLALMYKIASALKPQNPQLRMLKSWTEGAFGARPWVQPRLVLGLDDKVVGFQFADLVKWPGDQELTTNFDHSDLVKPESWTQSIIIDHIRNALKETR